jgi:hypothetical protein
VQLDVAIVHNTVADGTRVRFNHRVPHDQTGNVILNGNTDIRIWNDILPSISLATGEANPATSSGRAGEAARTTSRRRPRSPVRTSGSQPTAPASTQRS